MNPSGVTEKTLHSSSVDVIATLRLSLVLSSSPYLTATACSIAKPVSLTTLPRRSQASTSTLVAGTNSASKMIGAVLAILTNMSGCSAA